MYSALIAALTAINLQP